MSQLNQQAAQPNQFDASGLEFKKSWGGVENRITLYRGDKYSVLTWPRLDRRIAEIGAGSRSGSCRVAAWIPDDQIKATKILRTLDRASVLALHESESFNSAELTEFTVEVRKCTSGVFELTVEDAFDLAMTLHVGEALKNSLSPVLESSRNASPPLAIKGLVGVAALTLRPLAFALVGCVATIAAQVMIFSGKANATPQIASAQNSTAAAPSPPAVSVGLPGERSIK